MCSLLLNAYSPKISMLIPPEGRQTQANTSGVLCLDNLSCMKAFGFEVADFFQIFLTLEGCLNSSKHAPHALMNDMFLDWE